MNILLASLQCGAFFIIPIATFGFGLRYILKLNSKYQYSGIAGVIEFTFSEASLIGMLIDPRASQMNFKEIILASAAIGIGAFLAVVLFTPIARLIFQAFIKKQLTLYQSRTNCFCH